MKVIQNQVIKNELIEKCVLVNCKITKCNLIGCKMIGGDINNCLVEQSVLVEVKLKDLDIDFDESHFINCTTFE